MVTRLSVSEWERDLPAAPAGIRQDGSAPRFREPLPSHVNKKVFTVRNNRKCGDREAPGWEKLGDSTAWPRIQLVIFSTRAGPGRTRGTLWMRGVCPPRPHEAHREKGTASSSFTVLRAQTPFQEGPLPTALPRVTRPSSNRWEGRRGNLARFAPFKIHSLVVIRSHFPVGRQVKKSGFFTRRKRDGFVAGDQQCLLQSQINTATTMTTNAWQRATEKYAGWSILPPKYLDPISWLKIKGCYWKVTFYRKEKYLIF